MKKIILWFVGAFLMFTALGYLVGVKSASDPHRVSAYIASRTEVGLGNEIIEMRFRGGSNLVYWSYDLGRNAGKFSSEEQILKSLRPQTLTAESELLLKFIGGSALTLSAKDIVQNLAKGKESGNVRPQVAIILGGITGFGFGYYLGIKSVNFDSSEVLSFLRDKKNIELLKKTVYASMLRNLDLRQIRDQERKVILKDCQASEKIQAPEKIIDCYFKSSRLQDFIQRDVIRSALVSATMEKLSSNDASLEGPDFLVFFL